MVSLDFGCRPLWILCAKKSSVLRCEVCSLYRVMSQQGQNPLNASQTLLKCPDLGCGSLESKSALKSVVQHKYPWHFGPFLPGEGAKARWLSSTTKRYFTIDFTSQLFFYAQSESQKTVSHPIRFKDSVESNFEPWCSAVCLAEPDRIPPCPQA